MRTRNLACALAVLLAAGCKRKSGGDEHDHHEQEHARERRVELTPEAMQAANIALAVAERKPLATRLRASAKLVLPQDRVALVSARVPGRVAEIHVRLGQNLKKGDVLGVLESPQLGEARAAYLAASTKLRVADTNYQRERELVEKGISAARELREAEAARAAAEADVDALDARLHAFGLSEGDIRALKADEHYTSEFPIRSPIEGRVLAIKATAGQTVEGTAQLFTVGEPKELWAVLDVFEAQLPGIRVGQDVELAVTAVPDTRFRGRLDYIGDLVEEETRTIHVRVVVPNTDGRLKPGMFATAEIAGTETSSRSAIVVPREAVQRVGDADVVFVPAGPSSFEPVEVELGETSATEATIIRGLEAGAEVVTRGAFVLKSELSKESMGGHSH